MTLHRRNAADISVASCDVCGASEENVGGADQTRLAGWRRLYASTSHVMPYVGGGETLVTTAKNVVCSEKCAAEFLRRLAAAVEEEQGTRKESDVRFVSGAAEAKREGGRVEEDRPRPPMGLHLSLANDGTLTALHEGVVWVLSLSGRVFTSRTDEAYMTAWPVEVDNGRWLWAYNVAIGNKPAQRTAGGQSESPAAAMSAAHDALERLRKAFA